MIKDELIRLLEDQEVHIRNLKQCIDWIRLEPHEQGALDEIKKRVNSMEEGTQSMKWKVEKL